MTQSKTGRFAVALVLAASALSVPACNSNKKSGYFRNNGQGKNGAVKGVKVQIRAAKF